jgi:predicted membrane-bound spermidine synthase
LAEAPARRAWPSPPRSIFFLLFTISGFSGLIYESIWAQYLKLFLGHAAYAQTLVLALFMGGMAVGSALCSRYGARAANLLAAYAIAEAVIGLAALAFHPVYMTATQWAYGVILPGAGGETGAAAAKWLLAGVLILPQSVILGATFPLMSAGLIRRYPRAPGETLSMLYFTNSLGAALGVLASGFILIERLGLPGTVQAAGAMNLGLAAIVLVLARGGEPRPAPAAHAQEPRRESAYPLLAAVAMLTGTASFIYEIGWIRMLTLVLGASTHSFELMLSAFILGLALGGLWVRRRIDAVRDPARFLGVVQVAMGLLALATVPLYARTFDIMSALIHGLAKTDVGHALFLASSHGIALMVMLPATFCAGMTLPLITYALLRGGHGEKSIGAVYAWNTLGSIVGVVLAAHAGMPLLGLKGLIAVGAALDVALGLALLWRVRGAPALPAAVTALVLAAFAVVLAGFPLDSYRMASGVFRRGEVYREPQAHLVLHKDGKTSTVSLMDFEEGRSLRTNGKSDGAIAMDPEAPRIADELTMVLTAALPLAYRPDAKRVAVIGLGTGLTTHTLLANPGVEAVDTIEIEPLMAEASRGFAPYNANAFADPRSRIVFDDAKSYFSTGNRRYDIIISEPSNPWVSGVSGLFTREFYALARRYLEPGGVLAQWFQLYEIDESLVASVMVALGEVFPDYAIYATTSNDLLIIAGSREALARPLADVTRIPALAQELRRIHVHTRGDLELRRLGGKDVLAPLFASYGVPANSDYRPYLDLHAAKYRFLQRHAGDLTELGTTLMPLVALLEGRLSDWTDAPSLDGAGYLDKIDGLRRAYYARAIALRQPSRAVGDIPGALQKDLEIARQGAPCSDPARFELWFNALFSITRSVAPVLPAREASEAWNALTQIPCARALAPAQAAWIELLRAVARRDAKAMAALAEKLLDPALEHGATQRQYLVMAAMAGHLATGQRDKAAALWSKHRDAMEQPPPLALRLLYAHAFPSETMR